MILLIPLGGGSIWNDNELRYSLRSAEMYLPITGVIIVGNKPKWLQNVTHLPYGDLPWFTNAAKNIHHKIMQSPVEDFVLWNDDYFATDYIPEIQPYHNGPLKDRLPHYNNNLYSNVIRNTIDAGCTLNFDIHYPIAINLTQYKATVAAADWSKPYGYGIKSLYTQEGTFRPDCKISERLTYEQITSVANSVDLFSIGNMALNSHMRKWLQHKYPNPSRYESHTN